jgi:DNA polymerase III subunit epsilon
MTNSVTPTLRQRAIETARAILKNNPVYLDTETTGLGPTDEILEITIIDDTAAPLINTLVKPSQPIPPSSTAIHGITNEEVQSARAWPIVWPEVRGAFFSRLVVIYNAEFDLRMLQQTHGRYKLPWKERVNSFDLLKLYSEYHGEWDPRRRAYRYISLDAAGKQCGISLPNAHRALADTLLTRALLRHMAGEPY